MQVYKRYDIFLFVETKPDVNSVKLIAICSGNPWRTIQRGWRETG